MYRCYEAWQYAQCPAWLQQEIVPVTAGFLLAEPNYEVRPRILQDYYLVWMRSGSGSLRSRGKQFPLRKNDLFVLFPNVVHAYQTDPEDLMELFWMGFHGVSAKTLVQKAGFSPDAPVFSCDEAPRTLDALRSLAEPPQGSETGKLLEASGQITRLFGTLVSARGIEAAPGRTRQEMSRFATVAHNFINMHYPEKVTVADLARHVGVGRLQLTKLFQAELGQPPAQYLRYVRMKRAVNFLLQTSLPIGEIARRVGYEDPLYFTKVFSKQYGTSPSKFRLLAQSNSGAQF